MSKIYENDRNKFLKAKLNEGNSEAGPPPELFIEDRWQDGGTQACNCRIDNIQEKLYIKYLTDRTMQAYNYEITMLINTRRKYVKA